MASHEQRRHRRRVRWWLCFFSFVRFRIHNGHRPQSSSKVACNGMQAGYADKFVPLIMSSITANLFPQCDGNRRSFAAYHDCDMNVLVDCVRFMPPSRGSCTGGRVSKSCNFVNVVPSNVASIRPKLISRGSFAKNRLTETSLAAVASLPTVRRSAIASLPLCTSGS
jgi:hypothetical protein